jgi:septum formation protein
MSTQLYLASSSPRRQEILDALGLSFEVLHVDIDEARLPDEAPEQMVLRLASEKAASAMVVGDYAVLGADTAVVLGERVLDKPRDRSDAEDMLLSLSGRTHRVVTGVALRTSVGSSTIFTSTEVSFREISRHEASRYWHSGEPQGKAGAYGIQGLGGVFVAAIRGSYSGVVGLPVFETATLLRAVGIDVLVNESDAQ